MLTGADKRVSESAESDHKAACKRHPYSGKKVCRGGFRRQAVIETGIADDCSVFGYSPTKWRGDHPVNQLQSCEQPDDANGQASISAGERAPIGCNHSPPSPRAQSPN